MHVSSICLVSCTLISVTEPLLTLSRCHRQLGRRSADLSMVRLIIQDHIAAVHEFAIASDRLKGTSDSNGGCRMSIMEDADSKRLASAPRHWDCGRVMLPKQGVARGIVSTTRDYGHDCGGRQRQSRSTVGARRDRSRGSSRALP